MLHEQIEPAWLKAFEAVLRRCALQPDHTVGVLCKTQSRPLPIELARLSAARRGAQTFVLKPPPVFAAHGPTGRSTGACKAVGDRAPDRAPAVAALQACALVVHCTVAGLMPTSKLLKNLKGGGHTAVHPGKVETV